MSESTTARPYVLAEASYRQLLDYKPNVAVLPWGATEAHNFHLPHGTDIIEASDVAIAAAKIAHGRGGKPIVLPPIPFGNNEQQLDQVATISITTRTAAAILRDVIRSLAKQNIDRFVIVNAHGGNEFKPVVRDMQGEFKTLIVVINFWNVKIYKPDPACATEGDHANEMETSLLLHLRPDWIDLNTAGPGSRVPFALKSLSQPGVWTPRPWSASHPDTGSGDPSRATAGKGRAYFEAVTSAIADMLVELSDAKKGQIPYL